MNKKILRLKLTDFINTHIEESVINFLYMIKETTPTFIVHCWYKDGDISKLELNKFINRYSQQIKKIEMSFYILNSYEKPVWYDIINNNDAELLSHYKFRSTYDNTDDLINCILEFNNLIKFDIKKNISYNKNGHNKDDKNSYNRFKKMGKQSEAQKYNF